ncbi:MAG: 4-hydroxy-tetrahydrodipicolinate reductase, partial [Rhizobiales bacterium]|nr:4-hydroxy-tetrahydrodipicolinate reductase [Hyphomicrobiales bacterium]
MSDMRLVIAGAGGRMGRTLVKAVAATPGLVVSGALEHDGSSLIGEDVHVLAGLPAAGVTISADAGALLAHADAVIDFTVPRATLALAPLAAAAGCAHVIGT